MIRKRWAQLCAMPSVKRELEVAQLARQALRQAKSEASELKTSVQELTQRLPTLTSLVEGGLKHNQKKKRTVDQKIDTAVSDMLEALEPLTKLQKKRALKQLKTVLL